jgi:hypothetical protein
MAVSFDLYATPLSALLHHTFETDFPAIPADEGAQK